MPKNDINDKYLHKEPVIILSITKDISLSNIWNIKND